MRTVDRTRVRAMPGSTVIGRRTGVTMRGWLDGGIVLLMKAHIGTIPTTITTGRVGSCMKATGIMKITKGTAAKITDTTTTTASQGW